MCICLKGVIRDTYSGVVAHCYTYCSHILSLSSVLVIRKVTCEYILHVSPQKSEKEMGIMMHVIGCILLPEYENATSCGAQQLSRNAHDHEDMIRCPELDRRWNKVAAVPLVFDGHVEFRPSSPLQRMIEIVFFIAARCWSIDL